VGRRNKKEEVPEGEWEKMSPQQKADWFDKSYSDHKRPRKSQVYKQVRKHKKG
jgi:hypothetical protein